MNKAFAPTPYDYAAWTLAALGIVLILSVHLLPALIAGLLIYELVHVLTPVFARRLSTRRARTLAVALVASLAILIVTAFGFGIVAFMRSEGGSFSALMGRMADILESSRTSLPDWLANYLPNNVDDVRDYLSRWLREHASEVQLIGKQTGLMLAHILIGMIIGGMVSLREAGTCKNLGPLARSLSERVFRMSEAFRRVVFAQIRISALNTLFSGLYLAFALPLCDVHLPLTKTMIVVTFIAGLLPVVGNLISNGIIFIVSLAHSPFIALSSLGYLIVIHKLEYFLNARIVGNQIRAKAWEMLTAMLLMESVFGLAGLAAAPICYAWLKDELFSRKLL